MNYKNQRDELFNVVNNNYGNNYNSFYEKSWETNGHKDRTKKLINLGIIIVAVLMVIIGIGILMMKYVFKSNANTIKQVIKIEEKDVTDLEIIQVQEMLSDFVDKRLNNELIYTVSNFELKMFGKNIDLEYNIDEIIEQIKVAKENKKSINCKLNINYSQNKLREIYEMVDYKIKESNKENIILDLQKLELNVDKISKKYGINEFDFNNIILSNYKSFEISEKTNIPVLEIIGEKIDFERIYKIAKKEAKDAKELENGEITAEEYGIDFELDQENLKKEFESKDVMKFKLKRIMPSVTKAEILKQKNNKVGDDILFENTYILDDNPGRKINVEKAIFMVNGLIIKDGEEFSYNKTLGKRTREKGYVDGPVYANGKIKNDLAGGICMVSSAIYEGVLKSGFEIKERHNHGFMPAYVEKGLDAAVVYDSMDFIFKNNSKTPIKLVFELNGKKLNFKILGKIDSSRKVEVNTTKSNEENFEEEKVYSPNLKPEETKVSQQGIKGYTIQVVRKIYENGRLKENKIISRDKYSPLKKIIEVGDINSIYLD